MLFVDILKMLASALHLGESSSNCLMIFVYQALRPKAPILYRQMKKKKNKEETWHHRHYLLTHYPTSTMKTVFLFSVPELFLLMH